MSHKAIAVEMPVGMFYRNRIMTIFRVGDQYEVDYGTLPNATACSPIADNDERKSPRE